MSLRRRSCETCFKGKRKCDLGTPICKRCQRTGKECRYIYHHISGADTDAYKYKERRNTFFKRASLSHSDHVPVTLNIPNLLGPLGDVRPIIGQAKSWEWLIAELKSFPVAFGQTGEAGFIHKGVYAECASTLRTAYGLCLAHQMSPAGDSGSSLMKMMENEVVQLFNMPASPSLLDDLARLQALVLYQIVRLLHGDLEQRMTADYQETMVESLALRLSNRVNTEIGLVPTTWNKWLIAESVRRTVMVTFILYCVYSTHTLGVSSCFATMATLPIATRQELWESEQAFTTEVDNSESYQDFAESWVVNPWRQLRPFERMLMVPCKGLDKVDSYVIKATA